jgi:hypothetical protein
VDAQAQLLAQNAPIEQSRLFNQPSGPQSPGLTPDGMVLGNAGPSDDDSFGAQQILKSQQKVREFIVSGDASIIYTNNVALTRSPEISDAFVVAGAGLSWVHTLNPQWQIQAGGHLSLFRYFDTSALDFENLTAGFGVNWIPVPAWGMSVFARYDFTELLDKHSRELLEDHEFSFGVEKAIVFNRVHGVSFGALGTVGISDPFAAQRDSIAGYGAYHLAITRRLQADVSYRLAGYFYNSGDRNDFNQTVSLGMRYRFNQWMEASYLLFSGFNRSDKSVFSYDVLNTGGTFALTLTF